jgi:hypothetical protein
MVLLLDGMGPVDPPRTDGGKLFAGFYALYAGLVFLIMAAMLFTPVLHRLLHKFHWHQSSWHDAPSRVPGRMSVRT